MRKCGACGYLIFGDGDSCTHCGARLAAPSVAPPPLQNPPPVPRPFGGAPRSAPPPAPADPAVGNPTPSSTRVGRIAVTVVILLVIAGVAGAIAQRSKSAPPGTRAYVDGHGIDYTSPDRTYSAQLPQRPKVEQQSVNVGAYTATMSLSLVQTSDYELGTASVQLPVEIPAARLNAALDDAMAEGLGTVSDGGSLHARRFRRGGLPAAEVSFKAKDGYGAHALVVFGGNTIFFMFSHAKRGADNLFHALDKSFKVNVGL